MYWRLNRIQYPVYNLGPGTRLGIWVQGCSLRCPGCLSKSLWSPRRGKNIPVEWLVHQISTAQAIFDGITITGGEPFDQYVPLIAFCAFIKQKTDLNIYTYSGYTLAELEQQHRDGLFRRYMDYLLDGRYRAEQHDDVQERGSKNQNLYRFVGAQAILQDSFNRNSCWSVAVSTDQQVYMAGIPRSRDLEILQTELKKMGLNLRFQ